MDSRPRLALLSRKQTVGTHVLACRTKRCLLQSRLGVVKTAVGIDVGLKEFVTTSDGNTEPIQQNFRRSQKRLARHQRKQARMQPGSSNSIKQKNRIARIHQRIKRQRQEFHYKVANKLVNTYDLIGVEDLNIKGLARTRLAKSILDAAWGEFIRILEAVAVKRGVRVVKVKPHGTSVDCSSCGWKVPKTLEIRIHDCPKCRTVLDRDLNAAINILMRALNAVGLTGSACEGQGNTQPLNQECLEVILGSHHYTACG